VKKLAGYQPVFQLAKQLLRKFKAKRQKPTVALGQTIGFNQKISF
jgi:hypothetical protein